MLRSVSACLRRWPNHRSSLPPVLHTRCTPPRCHAYATLSSLNSLPSLGDKLHGFTLQGKKHVPELQLTALRLEHDKTGADYLHLAREDNNNVFSIGFKTNPPDATGVPHILEHTTLCGSKQYVLT